MTHWDRVERLFGSESLATLRQKKVAVIGLGSGGGFVAVGLAMSGVSHFVLLDDDILEPVNIVRHVADQRYLGQPKVHAVRDLIVQRNPQAEVVAIQGRIEDHTNLLSDVDLVVCAVDGEGSKFKINEICLAQRLPAIYAGVYERGEGGDVAMLYPYDGACYACWASNLREGYLSPSPQADQDLDYGQINEQGTLDAEPGLWLHVVRVASTQADLAINMLLKDTPAYRSLPGNTVVLANTALEIFEGRQTAPYSAEWVHIPRNPDCLVCGHQQSVDRLSLEGALGDMLEQQTDENQKTINKGSQS